MRETARGDKVTRARSVDQNTRRSSGGRRGAKDSVLALCTDWHVVVLCLTVILIWQLRLLVEAFAELARGSTFGKLFVGSVVGKVITRAFGV